jgi:predicted Holliday junction resolvase-like endonuclease
MNENDIQNHNEVDESQEAQAEETTQQQAEDDVQVEEKQPSEAAEYSAEEVIYEEPKMEEPVEKKKKHMKTGAVVAITAAATVAVCAIALFVCAKFFYNPYNSNCKYLPTLKDYAKYNNMTVDKVKEEYQLPKDMPDSTYWSVSSLYIPLSYIMQSQSVDLATIISQYQLPEECSSKVTESTTIGEFNKLLEEYSSTTSGN